MQFEIVYKYKLMIFQCYKMLQDRLHLHLFAEKVYRCRWKTQFG